MSSEGINELKLRLRDFAEARDWDQLTCMDALMPRVHGCTGAAHSPKNLSMALSAEVAEIVEHFQWLTEEQSKTLPKVKLKEVETELADTFIYLVRLADKLDIDLLKAAEDKITGNEQRYPVDKAKGNAKKYTELDG
ncbi:MAG: nucleotide pyrophosphohydrolase [Gammaproteobacteria bacterium]|nr:nucleotide pyrophosphohydrolase [Gammaproteobacteria bacterium]